MARALDRLLGETGGLPAGAAPLGVTLAGQFASGESATAHRQLEPGYCHHLAVRALAPVSGVRARLVPPSGATVELSEHAVGDAASGIVQIGPCVEVPASGAAAMTLEVTGGMGVVGVRLYRAPRR